MIVDCGVRNGEESAQRGGRNVACMSWEQGTENWGQ
jgi:hypothetical protein